MQMCMDILSMPYQQQQIQGGQCPGHLICFKTAKEEEEEREVWGVRGVSYQHGIMVQKMLFGMGTGWNSSD